MSTIYDSDFGLRVLARAKIDAGLLPNIRVHGDLGQSHREHLQPCAVCDQIIGADESWVRLVLTRIPDPRNPDLQLHEICYLAWCCEVLES